MYRKRLLAVLLGVLALPQSTLAVSRTCGSNALTNTTNVLCASPSGPCNSTSVVVSSPIEVTAGGCTFDLGGRALTIQKRFQMIGSGFIKMQNASDITLTSTGELKARGDFVKPQGFIIEGGTISLTSSGGITHRGALDVTGDGAGIIELNAAGTIQVLSGSVIRGTGLSSFNGVDARFADGGILRIKSSAGSITVDGPVDMSGQGNAAGGDVTLRAARNITVTQPIDASGGSSGGGSVEIVAGDNVALDHPITVDSRSGGGDGGEINVAAGEDSLGGIAAGGTVTIDDGSLSLQGSTASGFGGDGGDLDVGARGQLFVGGAVPIHAGAGLDYAGSGGTISLRSGSGTPHVPGLLDGDLVFDAPIVARSGASGGFGGQLTAESGRDLAISSAIDLGGKDGGGTASLTASDDFDFSGRITADATSATGLGGTVAADACTISVDPMAHLEVAGHTDGGITLTGGNHLTVSTSSVVEAGTGGPIALVTRTVASGNPDTGGSVAQFDPTPTVLADPTLPGCGLCAGVVCSAHDACHDAGTCDPSTGQCSNPPLDVCN